MISRHSGVAVTLALCLGGVGCARSRPDPEQLQAATWLASQQLQVAIGEGSNAQQLQVERQLADTVLELSAHARAMEALFGHLTTTAAPLSDVNEAEAQALADEIATTRAQLAALRDRLKVSPSILRWLDEGQALLDQAQGFAELSGQRFERGHSVVYRELIDAWNRWVDQTEQLASELELDPWPLWPGTSGTGLSD